MSLHFIFYQKLWERTLDVCVCVHFKVLSKTVCLESHTRTSRICPHHKQPSPGDYSFQPLQEENSSLLNNPKKQIPKIWLLFKSQKYVTVFSQLIGYSPDESDPLPLCRDRSLWRNQTHPLHQLLTIISLSSKPLTKTMVCPRSQTLSSVFVRTLCHCAFIVLH